MDEIAVAREVDDPRKQQIIELGINLRHSPQADIGSDQGEVDVGGAALAADGAGALENRLLHPGMGSKHLLDGADRRFGQAGAPRSLGQGGGRHRWAQARAAK